MATEINAADRIPMGVYREKFYIRRKSTHKRVNTKRHLILVLGTSHKLKNVM
jgi:hypothetical protein